jgi:tRNA A-37 threonylcarbamoyl transferase component Bud32
MNEAIKLFLAGKSVPESFDIEVDGERYHCERVLRWLPGRRLVIKARHHNTTLLLKLFVPNKKGWRELSREQHGYRSCLAAGVKVPQKKFLSDNFAGCLAIAYEYLEGAEVFTLHGKQQTQQVQGLLQFMVQCHLGGIYQQDIHTDNILQTAKGLYLIDLASVKGQPGQPLSAKKSLKNLARLLVQFVPDEQRVLLEKLSSYYQAREWVFDAQAHSDFKRLLDKAWHKRKDMYLSKCFRACTMTVYHKDRQQEYAFKRAFLKHIDESKIAGIDALVEQGEKIKDGNSATVVLTELGGRRVVIKRYNMKSVWHFVKRCWRPSRAANAWRQGNLMNLLGIPTPAVLGFVEHRFGPLRKRAYLVSEYVEHASELSQVYADEAPKEPELKQIRRIFNLMHEYRLSHGDMKASNLLLTQNGQVELIDLDAMQEHRYDWAFERAFARDQQRFMKNWRDVKSRNQLSSIIKVGH